MLRKIILTVIAVMCLQTVLSSQEISPFVNHLTMSDGLLDGVNYYLTKDSRGFVWISSLNGLNRYDGSQVMHYVVGESPGEIKGQYVQSKMFEDTTGNLYFTTYTGGINCYQRATDIFQAWKLPSADQTPVTGYHAFYLEQGKRLWVLVNNKSVYQFDTETHSFTHQFDVPYETHFCHMVTDGAGHPILCASNDHLGRLTLVNLRERGYSPVTKTLSFNKTSLKIAHLQPDGDSLIWFTDQRSLYSYHISKNQVNIHLTYSDSNTPTKDALEFYGKDTLLLAVGEGSLLFYDCRQNQIACYVEPHVTASNQLRNSNICAVNVLSDGSIWCNVCDKGLDFFHPGKIKFKVVSLHDAIESMDVATSITSMLEVNGEIFCSTKSQGVLVFDLKGNFIRQYHADSPGYWRLPSNTVRRLFADRDNRVWALTNRGLVILTPRLKLIMPDEFLAMCQLKDGKLLLAPRTGGLATLAESPDGTFTANAIEIIDKNTHYVRLWTDQYGRLFGNRDLVRVDVLSTEDGFRIQQQLPLSGEVDFLQEDNNSKIWAGSSQGLTGFNVNLDTSSLLRLTHQNGLPSDIVYALQQVRDAIWIGTEAGLSRFDLRNNSFTSYNTLDGLPSNKIGVGALLYASDGKLWIGTNDGIALADPTRLPAYHIPSLSVINNIRINDLVPANLVCSRTGASNVSEIKYLKLQPDENTVSFTIAALEYSNPRANRFSYFMEGLDADWIDAGSNNFIRYSKIPPGHYYFRYRTSNSEQQWGPVQTLELDVKPPFHQTWIFYTLVGITAMLLLYSVALYRKRKRLEKERLAAEKRAALEAERQRIARDMHDDLGSSLSALSLMTQIALSRKNGDLRPDLERINKSALEIGGKIREVIWMVSAKNDSLSSLVSFLHSYTMNLSKDTNLECQISIPEDLPDKQLGSEVRRNLYLCFKEAVNNALKYANANTLTIDIAYDNEILSITIADDGKGFDPVLIQESTGNGLRNMQERMWQIGGTCKIKTGRTGTTILFTAPTGEKVPS